MAAMTAQYAIVTFVVAAVLVGALVVMASRRGRLYSLGGLLSFFFFEFGVEFMALSVVQLAGLGAYSGLVAGAVAGGSTIAAILYMRPGVVRGLRAKVAASEIPPEHLRHVVTWLSSIIIEGEVLTEPERRGILETVGTLRKGESVSYDLITDGGKAARGTASVKTIETRAKADGRLFFSIVMKRETEAPRTS